MKASYLLICGLCFACSPHRKDDGATPDAATSCTDDDSCPLTCEEAAAARGYTGCEYWPVDLDNAIEVFGVPMNGSCAGLPGSPKMAMMDVCWDGIAVHGVCDPFSTCPSGSTCENRAVCALDAEHSPFAIVVSNPDKVTPVKVTLSGADGTSSVVTVDPLSVVPILPQQLGFQDRSLDGSELAPKAYHLESDHPIVAYQFNPLDQVGVFSNDASLLIPAATYDKDYLAMTVMSVGRRPAYHDFNGYLTVVAAGTTPTTVTITPKANVVAGPTVAAIAAGTPKTFTLQPFDVLNLEAEIWNDLTGSAITCSQPCGVFVGHEATTIAPPAQPKCCADHLEEQLYPSSTWGKHYALVSVMARSPASQDVYRIMAQKPNTHLTFTPPQAECPNLLSAGEFCELHVANGLQVDADQPILVGHFLQSEGGIGLDSGDPSFAFPAPTEQFRRNYVLLVPAQYHSNFINVVTPINGAVKLDGNDVTDQLAAFGMLKAGKLRVTAGQHRLECSERCGTEVYGWSNAVSYMFAGGLDLQTLVQ